MYKRNLWKSFMSMFYLCWEKDLVYPLNQIETQTVICSILPVEYNVGPVESSIDVDHVKFSWVWLCQPFLTPKVENEVLAEVENEVLKEAKWGTGRD